VRTQATQGQLEHPGITECTSTLAAFIQNKYQSIVFVQDSVSYGNSTTLVDYTSVSTLGSPEYDLTDCWASVSEADCQLFFNSSIMTVVVVANIIKCVIMILMVLRFTTPSLVTRGDAIASFLAFEDPTTLGLRRIEKSRIHRARWVFQENGAYAHSQKRWGSSLSRLKWGFSISMQVSQDRTHSSLSNFYEGASYSS
jgi:hypothetical protein